MAPSVLLTLCLLFQTAPADGAPVARAGDASWGRAEYGDWLVSHYGVSALYEFVTEKVILIEAGKRGLVPTEAQVAEAYEAEHQRILGAAYGGDSARWERDQAQSGFTAESARLLRMDALRTELALDAMIRADRDVSDEQVAARFHETYGENGERISIEVLFFNAYRDLVPGTRPDLPALKQAARVRAEAARAKFAAGATVTDLLADADDPGRTEFITQGLIAEYRPRVLGKEIEEAVLAIDKPGDVSPPIEVFDGVWLVRLRSRETVTLEQLHDELAAEMRGAPADTGEMLTYRNALMERYKPELLLH